MAYQQPIESPSTLQDAVVMNEPSASLGLELGRIRDHDGERPADSGLLNNESPEQGISESEPPASQGLPPELPSLFSEVVFVLTCSGGQLVSAILIGHVAVTQSIFASSLGLPPSEVPWLLGSSMLPCGLSVVISGSLADLLAPKPLLVGGFLWETLWQAIAAVSVSLRLKALFFFSRAMQGLAAGVLVSASMSVLGRVYQPGIRKTRVFSLMAAFSPFGYWLGCLQAGALSAHLPWIFGSTAILLSFLSLSAYLTIPALAPAKDSSDSEPPSIRQFDYAGAGLASIGTTLIIFGLTQGTPANWSPYTYSAIIVGFFMLVAFYYVENWVSRPLIPNNLWKTRGFGPLLISYFLGLGAYSGAWQFYAIQFWQRYQNASPLTTTLYILPNGIVGILAAYVVSKTLHVVPMHVIFTASMIAFALGPAFFLPQTPSTSYWALSLPGFILATFGPDMSFTAAAIFITSSVPRSYQGAAGSLLVTVQNLTVAIMTSISWAIGSRVEILPNDEIGLKGIKAIWWFGLASALTGALITATMVRIPKAEEKEHVH